MADKHDIMIVPETRRDIHGHELPDPTFSLEVRPRGEVGVKGPAAVIIRQGRMRVVIRMQDLFVDDGTCGEPDVWEGTVGDLVRDLKALSSYRAAWRDGETKVSR